MLLHKVPSRCAVCGGEVQSMAVMSCNTFGPGPDLDARPCGSARSMVEFIDHCAHCGYCSPDIKTYTGDALQVLQSPAYRQMLGEKKMPKRACYWNCASLLMEYEEDFSKAGKFAQCAAWLCDDEKAKPAAIQMRERACQLFEKANQHHQTFAEDKLAETAILLDLYRRMGQFQTALHKIDANAQSMPSTEESSTLDTIEFQRHLCQLENVACYNERELERFRKQRQQWVPPRWWELWR